MSEVVSAVISSETIGGNMLQQAKNNTQYTITVSESDCKEHWPANRWPHCELSMLDNASSTVHVGLFEYQDDNTIWNPIDALIHELLHGADMMANGMATLNDQEINSILAGIKNNPKTYEKLQDILQRYPPRGRYDKKSYILTMYE